MYPWQRELCNSQTAGWKTRFSKQAGMRAPRATIAVTFLPQHQPHQGAGIDAVGCCPSATAPTPLWTRHRRHAFQSVRSLCPSPQTQSPRLKYPVGQHQLLCLCLRDLGFEGARISPFRVPTKIPRSSRQQKVVHTMND